ncbi:hypothetical protein [Methylobacterium trifolii]|uniref:Uncharacterized protein n=1 Tax=Methylobacterium trifolii TaxID=1003092 RepID=A0ABQ4U2H2_9HYPH|nr:hypothetical protein [Methylobacterium trifolii]GJE61651.1 hypothetical protein MPOCJGCO_3774 [Methylobacterium trifolii]
MRMLLIALAIISFAGAAVANPPIDEVQNGLCLELKVDGVTKACNNDMLLKDDGKGSLDFITGFTGERGAKKTVVDFELTQTSDLENSYGYALRIRGIKLMTYDDNTSISPYPATGICFMVKPNPVRAGNKNIRQDIVMMCTANISDSNAKIRKIDWKFVH